MLSSPENQFFLESELAHPIGALLANTRAAFGSRLMDLRPWSADPQHVAEVEL